MKTLNGCVRGVLCFIVFFCFWGLNAQEWRRYSREEAENQQKFRQRLETDKELKDAYERYMTAIKKQKDKLEADTEYQKLHQQLQEARKLLSKMRSEDRGGDEVTTQNRLIDTLERKLKERIDGNDDFKAGLTEISDSRRKLMALLEKNEISLYDFRLTMEDFLRDGDIELVEDTQSNYELREDNPFKDAFSDLSKALFQRDFCIEAAEEITKALVSEFPDSSPEAIGKCLGFFYNTGAFMPAEVKSFDNAEEDVFDECVRILSWMRTLRQDDKAGLAAFHNARREVYQRMDDGSLFRFIWAFQWEGANHAEKWMDDFVRWISEHPEQSNLMKYVHELLNYNYEFDNKYDTTHMLMLEERLAPIEKKLKDPWILHVARSINAWRRAWNVRGGGYANSVSEQSWNAWGVEKERALREAQAAVRIHPEWPAGYLGILEDFGGHHIPEFLQLMRYRPDFTEAYRKMIWGLLPRWCGSHAHISALARVCMETRRYDTALPSIGFNLLGLVAADTSPWTHWNSVYRQKWLEPLAIELFDARIAQSQALRRDSRLDKALFFIAIGKYDDAAVLVKAIEAENGGREVVFPSWNGRHIGNWYVKVPAWEDALTHLRLMTGENAPQLQELENLAGDNRRCAEAIDRMAKFIKAHPQLNDKEKEFLIDLRARWQMPEEKGFTYALDSGWGVAFTPAFDKGHTKVIEEMMDAGIDYKKYEPFPGSFALHLAREGTDPTMLELLKRMGDPLDRPEKNPFYQGDRPIHMAVMDSNIPMLKKLLELGISPESRNDHGHTPMHFCAQHGSIEGITVLLAAGASPDVQDIDGDTPLMFIPQTQVSPQCLRLLAKASKDVNIGNGAGMTALHYAAQCGESPEYIKILLEAGADPQARTPAGKAPYDLAMARNRRDLAALLPKPDSKGGKVYQTMRNTPARKVPKVASSGGNGWLEMALTFIAMPEIYGTLAFIVIAGIVFVIVWRRRRN